MHKKTLLQIIAFAIPFLKDHFAVLSLWDELPGSLEYAEKIKVKERKKNHLEKVWIKSLHSGQKIVWILYLAMSLF